jgi:dCMP deaminase
MTNRKSWDDYFRDIAQLVASRSTCLRRQVGAVLVKDHQILSTGYNGAPANIKHCEQTGCLREQLSVPSDEKHELCRGTHAEQNAICQAAKHGISIHGSTLYCTNLPCIICAKMLINAGILEIHYDAGYGDQTARQLLKEAGIRLYYKDDSLTF